MEILRFVLILACCCTVVVSNVIDWKQMMKQKLSKLSHTKMSNSPRTAVGSQANTNNSPGAAVGSQGSSEFLDWLDLICTVSKDCVPCTYIRNWFEYCDPHYDDTAFDFGTSDVGSADGQCTQWIWTCNSTYTCFRLLFYNDNEEDDCKKDKCEQNQFQCPNSTDCIPCAKFRDGNNDCGDNSDESGSLHSSEDYSGESFDCPAGSTNKEKTIPKSWLCDNYNDCGDASDESLAYCPKRYCEKCEIKCNTTNICIPPRYYDDGDNDCGDFSDEPNYHFDDCFSNPCHHGSCLDRFKDYTCYCDPGYEGINCDIDIDDCFPDPCIHGSCIDQVDSYICKCDPGYEGINCDIADDKCKQNEFQCHTSEDCIPCAKLFDGDNDCGDNSDESISSFIEYHDVEGFVNCTAGSPFEGMEIPRSWLCDNYDDCGDASDESLVYCPKRDCNSCEKKCTTYNMCIPDGYSGPGFNNCLDDAEEPDHPPQKSNFFHKLLKKSHGFNPVKGR